MLQINTRLETVDRYHFLKEKAAVNCAAREAGFTELASTPERTVHHKRKSFGNPVFSACAAVCERLGIPTREPPGAWRMEEARTFTIGLNGCGGAQILSKDVGC